jgi:hypothetical protein
MLEPWLESFVGQTTPQGALETVVDDGCAFPTSICSQPSAGALARHGAGANWSGSARGGLLAS